MTDQPPCTRCGQPHPKCTAHTRAGNPCRQQPMTGQSVCRMHGGKAPQAITAAERRAIERQTLKALETFGIPVEVDPHEALLQELHRTAGEVAWLGAIVAELERDDVVWGRVREKTGGEDHGTTSEARPNAWVELWHRQRRHLVEVSKACVTAGIEERRVRLAEDAGRTLAGVVRAVLDRLNLTSEQLTLVPVVVPEELRRAGGGGA